MSARECRYSFHLISQSVHVNTSNDVGMSPLHASCGNNQVEVVKILLKCQDIETEHGDNSGRTVFHLACQDGNETIVVDLIHHPVNINKTDVYNWSPLKTICYSNKIYVVTVLLKCDKIDIDHSNNSGCAAFYLACQNGNDEIIE